jgi:hypothetical protein
MLEKTFVPKKINFETRSGVFSILPPFFIHSFFSVLAFAIKTGRSNLLTDLQGDQIAQIFACWVVVYFA